MTLPATILRTLLVAMMCTFITHGQVALAREPVFPPNAETCWTPPPPRTLEETFKVLQNPQRGWRTSLTQETAATALALSGGSHRAAFAGGVLVGWSETGQRPDFHVVTAVDASAVIAPFAFLGARGDAAITALFNCPSQSWKDVADRAVTLLDATAMQEIARKHRAGGRLLVALSGSPVRPDTMWDFGLIAASGDPKAIEYLRLILQAAVNPQRALEPSQIGLPAGVKLKRNWAHARNGVGEAFLPPKAARRETLRYYLIHNGVEAEQDEDYLLARRATEPGELQLVPAHDVFEDANTVRAQSLIAYATSDAVQPTSSYDAVFLKGVFAKAFRSARMGSAWRAAAGPAAQRR
jgi:SAM-dependent methyltransferase